MVGKNGGQKNLPTLQNYKDCIYNTIANWIVVSGMERSGFPETLLGFGKSYLIPETTKQIYIWIFGYLFREWSEADFPKLLYRFREIVPHSRNNKFIFGYLFREWSEADFPKLLCYIGFGKSYLIPEITNFDIGEGIDIRKDF